MATVTITTTGAQDARIAPALGWKLGLGRNATATEVKAYLIDVGLRQVVRDYESYVAAAAAVATVTPIDPS